MEKFIVKNLDCPHCAKEVEEAVAKVSGIKNVSLNFLSGTLEFESESTEATKKAMKTAVDTEPEITLTHVHKDDMPCEICSGGKLAEKFIVKNLDCPNCAKEVEEAVAKVPGIKNVSLNFLSGTLEFESESVMATKRALKAAADTEPEITLSRADSGKTKKNTEDVDNEKGEVIRLVIAFILFAAAFFAGSKIGTALYMISYFAVGYPVIFRAAKKGGLDENFLMAVASCGAFVTGNFAEGAAVMIFYCLGEYFQDKAVKRNRKSIGALMDISPDFAVLEDGRTVDPEDVNVGDIIIVKPGEKIPLDGVVTDGKTEIDCSSLTGESVPVFAENGSEVLSGSLNLSGSIKVKVSHKYVDGTVSKILELVENASAKKAKTEKFITSFAKVYTPIVTALAVIIAIIPGLITRDFSTWAYRGLSFLVVSCPCALVISVPLTFYNGISRCAKRGILIKGGSVLEQIGNIKNIIFDKTGTLTKGSFKISEIKPNGVEENELLKFAAYCERLSNHPIAKSICEAYEGDVDLSEIADFEEIAGKGISCKIKGDTALAGNRALMADNGLTAFDTEGTSVHFARNGVYLGAITLEDEIKDKNIVSELKSCGVDKTYMLTGDSESSAKRTADILKLDKYYSSLLPQDKVRLTKEISATGTTMAVGDGINDAPMLALSDVSVAMGSGSAASAEAADIVLMMDSISKLCDIFSLAKRTMGRVNQNIYFSIGIKILILILTAFGITGMWAAVFADVGVSILAIINAIRK